MAVVGKTAGEISARAETFSELAHIQMWLPDFVALNMEFPDENANILAEVYFSLSEAYKRKRLKPGSRTEWTKAAAFSAITVALVKPLREKAGTRKRGQPRDPIWLMVNPIFAMTCAYGFRHNHFEYKSFDEKHRIYRVLLGLNFPSIRPVIKEGNERAGKFKSKWKINLSRTELATMDLLVAYFVSLLENEQILLQREKRK